MNDSSIDLVKKFVNTYDVETSEDVIGTPAEMSAWLREHGLPAARPSRADVEHVLEVREALRAVLLANNGGPQPADALELLDQAGRRAMLRVAFDPDGLAHLEVAATGIDAAVGRLLAAVASIQSGGDWVRLKACAASTCQFAYYDESRNRSRHWCSMEVCGNRAKARSYRARGGA